MKRRKLPIGIQTFLEMREGGYYYVDKTGLALRLIEEGKYLSSPPLPLFLAAPAFALRRGFSDGRGVNQLLVAGYLCLSDRGQDQMASRNSTV